MIKQSWLSDSVDEFLGKSGKTNLIDFVLNFREKIQSAVQMANENTLVSQSKSKIGIDRKTKVISFSPGDKVLVFLPLKSKPLQAQYCGPYEILEKLGPVDYVIATPDRRKSKRVCHINLMKHYK